MIELHLNTLNDVTLSLGDRVYLVGSRFAVTERFVKRGVRERMVTVVMDGIHNNGGWLIHEPMDEIIEMIKEQTLEYVG